MMVFIIYQLPPCDVVGCIFLIVLEYWEAPGVIFSISLAGILFRYGTVLSSYNKPSQVNINSILISASYVNKWFLT